METVLASGIAGQTRSKTDIKCVHAQIADGLCRSNANGVAVELMRRLEERGGAMADGDVCKAQCDLALPEGEARNTWWYEPVKNKWKLRKKQARRSLRKRSVRLELAAKQRLGGEEVLDEEEELRELDRSSG